MGNKDVCIISGYGPQENWRLEDKMPFFRALEEEIIKAKMNDKLLYIQLDANSKLGSNVIEGDPHSQSANGKMLIEILHRHAIYLINSIKDKCKGKITRRRITSKVKEESIIDFVLGCEDIVNMTQELVIDEEKKYVLTKYTKTKKGVKIQESDHNSLITHLKATWNRNTNIKGLNCTI